MQIPQTHPNVTNLSIDKLFISENKLSRELMPPKIKNARAVNIPTKVNN